jgi:zinc finger MIZ domain-containing protein
MRIAGRFKPCVHMGCFDLETFVELNQRSRKVRLCLQKHIQIYICKLGLF